MARKLATKFKSLIYKSFSGFFSVRRNPTAHRTLPTLETLDVEPTLPTLETLLTDSDMTVNGENHPDKAALTPETGQKRDGRPAIHQRGWRIQSVLGIGQIQARPVRFTAWPDGRFRLSSPLPL